MHTHEIDIDHFIQLSAKKHDYKNTLTAFTALNSLLDRRKTFSVVVNFSENPILIHKLLCLHIKFEGREECVCLRIMGVKWWTPEDA